jgi:hypothetical protein
MIYLLIVLALSTTVILTSFFYFSIKYSRKKQDTPDIKLNVAIKEQSENGESFMPEKEKIFMPYEKVIIAETEAQVNERLKNIVSNDREKPFAKMSTPDISELPDIQKETEIEEVKVENSIQEVKIKTRKPYKKRAKPQ